VQHVSDGKVTKEISLPLFLKGGPSPPSFPKRGKGEEHSTLGEKGRREPFGQSGGRQSRGSASSVVTGEGGRVRVHPKEKNSN